MSAHQELSDVDSTALWYRDLVAWPVEICGDRVVLPAGGSVTAFGVTPGLANEVCDRLKELHGKTHCTPVLSIGGANGRAVFLAETDDEVPDGFPMPHDVNHLDPVTDLALPHRVVLPGDDLTWLIPPVPTLRRLHPAATVLAIISAAALATASAELHVADS